MTVRWKTPIVMVLMGSMIAFIAACGTEPDSEEATPTPDDPVAQATPMPEGEFDAESYFEGERIRIVVGWSAGSTSDRQARFLANELPQYIPGQPGIDVTNMEGAGGDIGCNFVWRAEPDGLTWFGGNGCTHGNMLERADQVEYDAREWTHLGTFENRVMVGFIRGDHPYNRIQDALGGDETIVFGDEIPGAQEFFMRDVIDWPLEIRGGFESGTAEDALHFERGDVDFKVAGGLWYSLPEVRPGWFEEDVIEPMVVLADPSLTLHNNGEIDPPDDLKNIREFLSDEEIQEWDILTHSTGMLYRKYMMPPDTPSEIQEVLGQAFQDAFNDPEFMELFEDMHGRPPDELVLGPELDEFAQGFEIRDIDEVFAEYDSDYEPQLE